MASSEALDKLEEEVTCPVCLLCYSEPKVLQCFHVYCKKCLEGLLSKKGPDITCPVCQQTCPVPMGGVADLKTAFHIQHLIEIRESLRHDAKIQKPSSPGSEVYGTCSEHEGEELELYCETCDVLVCLHCTVRGRTHHKHDYELVKDVSARYAGEILATLKPVEDKLVAINSAEVMLDKRAKDVAEKSTTMEAEIHDVVRRFHTALDRKEDVLLEQLHYIREEKICNLSKEREWLRNTGAKLISCRNIVNENLRIRPPGDLVMMKQKLIQLIKEVSAMSECATPCDASGVTPSDTALHGITDMILVAMKEQDIQVGKVIASSSPNIEKFHAAGKGLEIATVGEMSTATVHAVNYKDTPCTEPVTCWQCLITSEITGEITATGSVERKGQSQYEIAYRPSMKGRHWLHISVDKQAIRGSPFTVMVHGHVRDLGQQLHTISDVQGPWGVAVSGGSELVVTEYSARSVSVFSPAGAKFQSFGTFGTNLGEFNRPHGVAVDNEGNILVVDNGNSRIQKFSSNGECLQSVGREGKGPLHFNCIQNIAYNPINNKIYIVDWNHCVQVLNSDLTFSSSFGKEGHKKGQFDHPWDITCDHTGKVYVSDTDNHRVQVFTPEGHFLKMLGCKGQDVQHPMGICVDVSGMLYMGHSGGRVSVFNSDEGTVVKSFMVEGEGPGSCDQTYLCGLAVDECGVLYVCDGFNNKVKLF